LKNSKIRLIKIPSLIKQSLIGICIIVTYNSFSFAQVNTESLRSDKLKNGLSNTLSFNLGLLSGNTEDSHIKIKLRSDYRSDQITAFIVSHFNRKETQGTLYQNKGFIHIRGVFPLQKSLKWESFAQKEFNDFIHLNDRYLLGLGLRQIIIKTEQAQNKATLYAGIGIMAEHEASGQETINTTDLIRSTNYLSFAFRKKEVFSLISILYYQVAFSALSDYRLLMDTKLGINVTQSMMISFNLKARYDNEPSSTIKRLDLDWTNALTITF